MTVRAYAQTNAVGLTDACLRLFDELTAQAGVSLDGGREEHSRRRRSASGRGSHPAVAATPERLRQSRCRHLFSNDPVATHEAPLAFGPPVIDLPLPHETWDAPAERDGNRGSPRTPTGRSRSLITGTATARGLADARVDHEAPAHGGVTRRRLGAPGADHHGSIKADGPVEQADSLTSPAIRSTPPRAFPARRRAGSG
jgi:hypothetical protein